MNMSIRGSISRRNWVRGVLAAAIGLAISGPVLLMTPSASAADAKASGWPQWRGPKQDGKSTETGLLKEWPKEGPPLAYKATGLGAANSTVSVVDGKIYTAGDVGEDAFLFALDEKDGKQIWKTRIGKAGLVGQPPFAGPRSTPTVDGDHLYVTGQFGDLLCAETATGKEVWRKNMEKDFGGKMMSSWGYSESPVVDGANL